jgi:DNA replication and repair protein RecF
LVIISPADRDLIVEGSRTRRKFMDSVISVGHYLKQLIQYQSNEPTQRFAEVFCVESCFENDTLAIYNEQLDGFARHFRKRKEFIEQFRPISIATIML